MYRKVGENRLADIHERRVERKVKNKMPLDSSKQLSRQEVFLGAWCEMAQWAKVLASEPDDSGSILGTHRVGSNNRLP